MNKWDKNYKRKSEEMLYGFMNKEPDLGESLRGMWDQEAWWGVAEAEMDLGPLQDMHITFKLHTWKNRTSICHNGRFFAEPSG